MNPLHNEGYQVGELRRRLIEIDDEDSTLTDALLEREESFLDLVSWAHENLLADESLLAGINQRLDDLWDRKKRIAERIEKKKTAIKDAMELGGFKKITLAEATLSIRNNPPIAVIIDESAIPEEYWREKITRSINLPELKDDLKQGVLVPGALLGNGSTSLSVRSK